MDAGDHVNTQLLIIIVIRENLSDYSNVILEVHCTNVNLKHFNLKISG